MSHPLEDLLRSCEGHSPCTHSKFKNVQDVLDKVVRFQPPFDNSVLNVAGSYYNDHGIAHFERIENNYYNLTDVAGIKLGCCEIYLALLSIWLHDIGLFLGRKKDESPEDARKYHHERVKDVLDLLVSKSHIAKMNNHEEALLTKICAGHSRKTDINSITETAPLNGETVRPRLLSAILRISDALDIDHRRAPESIFEIFEESIPEGSKKHWKKHKSISGIEFNRSRASIDVSVIFDNSLENFVEQFLLAYWVVTEIKSELDTVEDIFRNNNIPINNVNLKDLLTGKLLDTEIPASGYLLIGVNEDNLDNGKLEKLSELFKSNHGETSVFLEIYLREGGRVTMPLPDEYKITYHGSLQESIGNICEIILLNVKVDSKRVVVTR